MLPFSRTGGLSPRRVQEREHVIAYRLSSSRVLDIGLEEFEGTSLPDLRDVDGVSRILQVFRIQQLLNFAPVYHLGQNSVEMLPAYRSPKAWLVEKELDDIEAFKFRLSFGFGNVGIEHIEYLLLGKTVEAFSVTLGIHPLGTEESDNRALKLTFKERDTHSPYPKNSSGSDCAVNPRQAVSELLEAHRIRYVHFVNTISTYSFDSFYTFSRRYTSRIDTVIA